MTLSDVSSNPPLYQIEILIMFNYLESKNALKNQQIFPAGGSDELKTQKTQKEEKSSWKFQNISVIRIQIMCRNLTVVDPQSHTGNL